MVIKKVDERRLREFKAEAVRRGLTLSEAFEEAVELWLSCRPLFSEEDANHAAYLREKGRLKGLEGKYAVFAHGRFVGAFESLEAVAKALRALSPRPRHVVVVKVGVDRPPRGELEWWGGSLRL